jgi:hypothetical protein
MKTEEEEEEEEDTQIVLKRNITVYIEHSGEDSNVNGFAMMENTTPHYSLHIPSRWGCP